MKLVETDFDKAYEALNKLYEADKLNEKDGFKKAAVAAGLLASTAGLGACTPVDSSQANRAKADSNTQVVSQNDSSDNEYASLSYNNSSSEDNQKGSSSMTENKSALDVLHEAGLTQYGEQTIDETGTVRANNTYYFTESISYYPESNGLLITLDSGETIYTIDGHDRVKVVDALAHLDLPSGVDIQIKQ